MKTYYRHCGRCHKCRTPLKVDWAGEEYCPKCKKYRYYISHGWLLAGDDGSEYCRG